MKSALFFLSLTWALTRTISAQIAPNHHWVGFQDKVGCGVDLSAPNVGQALLSQRALDRRMRHGIALDSTDLPLCAHYVSDVLALGASNEGQALRVLHQSKWFNGIVVQIDTALADSSQVVALLAEIESLTSVAEVRRTNWHQSRGEMPVVPQRRRTPVLDESGTGPYGMAWNQTRQLRLDLIHGLGHKGQGMMVGVLDSGFDRIDTNPALERARQDGRIQVGGNFPNGGAISPFIYEEHSHGAMVLSTMAGVLDSSQAGPFMGSAPDAAYVLFRTEDVGWENLVEEYHWVAAAERADSMGCDILNTSLGYSLFDDTTAHHDLLELDGNTFRITQASDLAASKGMLVFNSAGNSGNSAWQKITAPADGDSVLAIGAVGANGVRASFSSFGPTADGRIKPDLCAMGQDAAYIHPDGSIRTGNGTSFSSPILCGAATSLWSAHPNQPAWAIRNALIESASQSTAPDTTRGYGIPDLWAAHLALGGTAPAEDEANVVVFPNPVPTASQRLKVMFREPMLLSAPSQPLEWTVLAASGRLISEGQMARGKEVLTTFTLHTAPLATGTYLLLLRGVPLEDKSATPTAWARFVVE